MKYHVGGGNGLVCCDLCATAMQRGHARFGWPRVVTFTTELRGLGEWTTEAREVLNAGVTPWGRLFRTCPLCGVDRDCSERRTAFLADQPLPNAVGTPASYADDVTAVGVSDLGPVTAEEAAEEARVAAQALIDAGAPHRGVRLPCTRDGRADWLYLEARAGRKKSVTSPTVGGGFLRLATTEEILAAVDAVGIYTEEVEESGVIARALAHAAPASLDAILAALQSDDRLATLRRMAGIA